MALRTGDVNRDETAHVHLLTTLPVLATMMHGSGERWFAVESELVDSLELEGMTGTKASTWRYWASLKPPHGPPSFKLGRRRVWRRSAVLAWLAEQEMATASGGQ